ncbi:DUF1746-domain-containing protein [Xylona heveae TC161]|uniref:DUF1746-domain-containing protein n=1 Tax=Xylona heveae (strain CBS 132557 / TC161) TaxID=1328760 RepID=A0A165JAV2_XYLHT|nr:DUF1746-domain-containing protein [Xylona heveae TC161]KZF25987.1 DUF1746-domain-containing protein [Xylona heveae TC161]
MDNMDGAGGQLSSDAPTITMPHRDTEEVESITPRSEERQLEIKLRQKKRLEFLDDLLRNFDIAIYCELSIVYYLDCSFLRFFLRAFTQFFYLTPKPAIFPEAPKNRPYVGAILTTNILCMVLHILLTPPEAGEAARGYLHGGLIIDFIGQLGPSSKVALVLLDCLILLLQLFMLSTFAEQQHFKDSSSSSSSSSPSRITTTSSPTHRQRTRLHQTLDAEERGLSASDIEMQALSAHSSSSSSPSSSSPSPPAAGTSSSQAQHHPETSSSSAGRTGGDQDGERDELLAEPSPDAGTSSSWDAYTSGEAVIADLYLLDTMRNPWRAFEGQEQGEAAVSSSSDSPSSSFPAFNAGGVRGLSFAERLARARQQRTRLGIRVRLAGRDIATL